MAYGLTHGCPVLGLICTDLTIGTGQSLFSRLHLREFYGWYAKWFRRVPWFCWFGWRRSRGL